MKNVVTFESTIVVNARSKPSPTARCTDLPRCCSSRMRSYTRMFASTAMPSVSTTPAMPGRVSVPSRNAIAPIRSTRLSSRATFAIRPAPK